MEVSAGRLLEAAAPVIVWAVAAALLITAERKGIVTVRINLVAMSGTLLALLSFAIGWSVIQRMSVDLIGGTTYSNLLWVVILFAAVTPLAWIGEAVLLSYSLALFTEGYPTTIEPLYAYVIAWMSCMLLIASMILPMGPGITGRKVLARDRLFTMTYSTSPKKTPLAEPGRAKVDSP